MSDESNDKDANPEEADRVYHSMREWILLGGLAVGSVVTLTALVRRYGTRRAVAREALERLEAEGLVEGDGTDEATVADHEGGRLGNIAQLADHWKRRIRHRDATPGSDFP